MSVSEKDSLKLFAMQKVLAFCVMQKHETGLADPVQKVNRVCNLAAAGMPAHQRGRQHDSRKRKVAEALTDSTHETIPATPPVHAPHAGLKCKLCRQALRADAVFYELRTKKRKVTALAAHGGRRNSKATSVGTRSPFFIVASRAVPS